MQPMTVRGICPHGKVRFMAVDEPGVIDTKVRREIGEMVSAGFTIDRVTVEEARKSDFGCDACDAARHFRTRRERPEQLRIGEENPELQPSGD